MESAQAFFRAAASQDGVPWPEKINVDGNSATHRGMQLLGGHDRWRGVDVRARGPSGILCESGRMIY
jgi:hypothetical protein